MNLLNVTRKFRTEDEALDYLIRARWPEGVRCLACNYATCYQIATRGKTGKPCRLFECAECKLHFSATTGTLFHDSHLPLTKWFMAMALMSEAKKGVSALQISRHIGVAYKTAWHLCHRIRKAMQELETAPLGGQGKVIEVDEAFIGGKTKGKGHKKAFEKKVRILGIAERGGKVHLQKIQDGKAGTLRAIFEKKLDPTTPVVVSDDAPVFASIFQPERHFAFKHEDDFSERGELTAKTVEGAFSLFKRGVIGSYHHLSEDHLDSYLQEFSWRYNRRKMQPFMFNTLLTELTRKKPLTYKKLTRETF
jgi:transposase-like protein